jgi:hypothetical protein
MGNAGQVISEPVVSDASLLFFLLFTENLQAGELHLAAMRDPL